MNLKLLQFGDLHLDAAHARLSPTRAAERRLAARELLTEIVDAAQRFGADLLLCTGDLFDSPTPYRDTVEAAVAAFRKVAIPVFIAPGNHDFYSRSSPYFAADWSENVHIFRSETPETVALPALGCTVTGCAFRSEQPWLTPLKDLQATHAERSIFVGHGDFAVAESSYAAFPAADVAAAGFDLVALGHIHKPEIFPVGKTLVVQNGSVESHGYDEIGERGYYAITLSDTGAAAELIGSSGSRTVRVQLPADCTDTAAILAALAATHTTPAARTMLRLECSADDPAALREALAAAYLDCKLIVTPAAAKQTEEQEDSPLLRLFAQRANAADVPAELAALAKRFGEAAMLHREAPRGEVLTAEGANDR